MNRRRVFLGLPACATALSAAIVEAQVLHKPLKVGFLSAGGTNPAIHGGESENTSLQALLQGLHDLGYRYGSDLFLEGRNGEGRVDQYVDIARELVASKVDVIVAAGPTVSAVRRATDRIPIIMVGGAVDPVQEGLVASLAAPGGNITGLTLQQVDLVGKRLELLKEVVPASVPIAVLWEENASGSWKAAQAAAAARGWQLLPYEVSERTAIAPACASAKAAGAGSLLVVSGGLLFAHASQVVRAATANKLPAMYALRVFPDHGGLMSYGADLADLYRRAATFVDRIAKGASPATMPMEQPTKFELIVNVKAAKTLGLTMPQTLLLRADEVIQ
jgi:putative ABC transport system substrate-binding protein